MRDMKEEKKPTCHPIVRTLSLVTVSAITGAPFALMAFMGAAKINPFLLRDRSDLVEAMRENPVGYIAFFPNLLLTTSLGYIYFPIAWGVLTKIFGSKEAFKKNAYDQMSDADICCSRLLFSLLVTYCAGDTGIAYGASVYDFFKFDRTLGALSFAFAFTAISLARIAGTYVFAAIIANLYSRLVSLCCPRPDRSMIPDNAALVHNHLLRNSRDYQKMFAGVDTISNSSDGSYHLMTSDDFSLEDKNEKFNYLFEYPAYKLLLAVTTLSAIYLAAVCTWPVMAPNEMKGWELFLSLFGADVDLGKSSNYQDPSYLVFGFFGVLPSIAFYLVALTSIPRELLTFGHKVVDGNSNKCAKVGWVILTAVLCGPVSFFSAEALHGIAIMASITGKLHYYGADWGSTWDGMINDGVDALGMLLAISSFLKILNMLMDYANVQTPPEGRTRMSSFCDFINHCTWGYQPPSATGYENRSHSRHGDIVGAELSANNMFKTAADQRREDLSAKLLGDTEQQQAAVGSAAVLVARNSEGDDGAGLHKFKLLKNH